MAIDTTSPIYGLYGQIESLNRELGFPLSGADIIRSTKDGSESIYINLIGALWFAHSDTRGLRSISSVCIVDAWDNDRARSKYSTTIIFKDGSWYRADGYASPHSTTNSNRDTINMIAETRSARRALIRATALTLLSHNITMSEEDNIHMKLEDANLPQITDGETQDTDILLDHHIDINSYRSGRRQDGSEWQVWTVRNIANNEVFEVWGAGKQPLETVRSFFSKHPTEILESVVLHKQEFVYTNKKTNEVTAGFKYILKDYQSPPNDQAPF